MKSYIIISNGSGGIATFQKYFIKNVLRVKDRVYLIDKKNNHTLKYFKKKEKKLINTYYCNPTFEFLKVFYYLNLIKKKHSKERLIFLFSNPLLLVLYFFFIKLKLSSSKIYLFIHSHMLKMSMSQILINIFSSLISPFINKIYFVSNFTKSWWLKYFFFYNFSNNQVCYNSVKLPKILKYKNKANRIGFVGRLEKEKGIDVFSNIMKYMIKYNFQFQIFGKGSYKEKIFKHKSITVNNWETQNKIYKKIDILLLTSPIENCPFTVLEAKSYGIPTLSISKGGTCEIVKNNINGIVLKKNTDFKTIKNSLFKIKKNIKKFRKNCIKDRYNFNEKVCFLKMLNKM